VLRRIAAIAPGDTVALEGLLPDRWVAAHPEHPNAELEYRKAIEWIVRRNGWAVTGTGASSTLTKLS